MVRWLRVLLIPFALALTPTISPFSLASDPDFLSIKRVIDGDTGHQLLEIINDLLDPDKLSSGDLVFNLASLVANLHYKVRLPINDVIGVSQTLLDNVAEQGRLETIADLKSSLPWWIGNLLKSCGAWGGHHQNSP